MLTPRAKTYVSVMKDTLDIRVGHRKRGGEAAEQEAAPVVARKQLVDLESEAALMFPARADPRKRGSAPPSRERMEREMRGVVTDPLPAPQWMASLGSLHASIAPSGGGGGDDDDGELRLILAGQDASSVRLRWVGGGGDTAHFVVYGNEALGFRKVYGGP